MAPKLFGKYELVERLSVGGFAEVWRATHQGRWIAIKRLLPFLTEDNEFVTMMIDETRLAIQLNHVNIAHVFDVGLIDGKCFIAMEYVSGKDARAIFDRGRKLGEPTPIPLACFLISEACNGLDWAHRKTNAQGQPLGIIHRDVSPHTVLVGYDGSVKLIDWTNKTLDTAGKSGPGVHRGKYAYLSPEQVRGEPLDRRSDVFNLGICLYELLTGERLFMADSDFAILEKVRDCVVPVPTQLPPALQAIVMKALARDVEARYQHASELGDALRAFAGEGFGRRDLAGYMQTKFAEDCARELQRLRVQPAGQGPANPEPADQGTNALLEQLNDKWGVSR